MQELIEILSGNDANPIVNQQMLAAFLDEFGTGEGLNGLQCGCFRFEQLRKDERGIGQIQILPVSAVKMPHHELTILLIPDANLPCCVVVAGIDPHRVLHPA